MATPLGTQWMGDSCTTTTTSNCKAIPWQEIILAYPSIISFLLRHFVSEKIHIIKLIKFMQNVIQCYTTTVIWYYSKIKLGGHWKNAIACVCYLFFSSNSKNYEKCFLFHLKTSFRSQDIQIFVFPFSLFFSLSASASEDH